MPGKEESPHTSDSLLLQAVLPQALQNSDELIIFCTDDSGKILLWNRAAEIVTGYSHAEVPDLKTLLWVAYPDATYREIVSTVRASFRKKDTKSIHYDTLLRSRTDQIRYISWIIERIPETDHNQQLYLTIGTDVTQARQNENDAILLNEIVNSSRDAIVGISPEGSILTWNHAAEDIFGYDTTESIGELFSRHIPDEKIDFFASTLGDVLNGKDFRGTIACLSKSKEVLTVSIALSSISGESGEVVGISAIIRDMTRELSIQQAMRDYISEATMRLSHPAKLIQVNIASLIERTREEDFDKGDILIELQVQQKALSEIIHNLRELSQAMISYFRENEREMTSDTIQ